MGYFIAFQLSRQQIREEIRADIQNGFIDHSLSTIVISNSQSNNIIWTDDNEFEFKGERYDIVTKKENGSQTTYYCLNDSKESILFSNLDLHIKSHVFDTKSNKNSNSKFGPDNIVKIVPTNVFSLNTDITEINHSLFPFINNYKFAVIKGNFQPPEISLG